MWNICAVLRKPHKPYMSHRTPLWAGNTKPCTNTLMGCVNRKEGRVDRRGLCNCENPVVQIFIITLNTKTTSVFPHLHTQQLWKLGRNNAGLRPPVFSTSIAGAAEPERCPFYVNHGKTLQTCIYIFSSRLLFFFFFLITALDSLLPGSWLINSKLSLEWDYIQLISPQF